MQSLSKCLAHKVQLFRVISISCALIVGVVWTSAGYSATSGDTDGLSHKEKIQQTVKDNVSTSVSAALKEAVTACKKDADDTVCKEQCPRFRLMNNDKAIACVSTCLSDSTLRCVAENISLKSAAAEPALSE